MEEKFRNRFRIKSARASWWDYSRNGYYFITICTYGKQNFFGKILDAKMNLSSIGKYAKKCWIEIPEHFPFVKLGEFVIMPNHVHGIVIIDKSEYRQSKNRDNKISFQVSLNKFGPQSKNLASIVRGFKTGVTMYARKINPGFKWQGRYYDHIITERKELLSISKYIRNNPLKWNEDEYFDFNLMDEEA